MSDALDQEVVCSECLAEPNCDLPPVLALAGWDLDGEFGARCPSCVSENVLPTTTEGIDGVAAVTKSNKKE